MKFITFIGEFQRKERYVLIYKFEEYFVTFPHCELEKAFLFDPFEVALVADDLVASPFGTDEEVHVFAFPDVGDEGDDATVAPLGDGISSFFPHFAEHAVFGALPFLEMAAHSEPFVVVQVVFFFGSMEHEVLGASFQVAEGGLFQL